MNIGQILHDLLFDYTLRTVALGAGSLGLIAGALGSFALLRKQSLLGDAMSHAALPGICLVFMLTLSKDPLLLLVAGGGLAGWIGALLVMLIVRRTRIKQDSAQGIVLSVFFGFGTVLLTVIKNMPSGNKAGLNKFLWGSASTLIASDVTKIATIGVVALLIIALFWKQFKLLSFDPDFAHCSGIPVRVMDVLLTTLIVLSIVIGLQTVGVVLMSAMLIAPAASARQWTDRMGRMVFLAAAFGAFSGVAGAIHSSQVDDLPTGPTIVIYVSVIVMVSLLFAPNRGLLWAWVRDYRHRRSMRAETVLVNLARLEDPLHEHGHDVRVLGAFGRLPANSVMEQLARQGWAVRVNSHRWALTPEGVSRAAELMQPSRG
ncbi:metal ABC transporter permease [Candidatus Sumerlaeota bacterium]|nr:metal ABC transporter permease [Candidatus Sumerlaeota bacterium]